MNRRSFQPWHLAWMIPLFTVALYMGGNLAMDTWYNAQGPFGPLINNYQTQQYLQQTAQARATPVDEPKTLNQASGAILASNMSSSILWDAQERGVPLPTTPEGYLASPYFLYWPRTLTGAPWTLEHSGKTTQNLMAASGPASWGIVSLLPYSYGAMAQPGAIHATASFQIPMPMAGVQPGISATTMTGSFFSLTDCTGQPRLSWTQWTLAEQEAALIGSPLAETLVEQASRLNGPPTIEQLFDDCGLTFIEEQWAPLKARVTELRCYTFPGTRGKRPGAQPALPGVTLAVVLDGVEVFTEGIPPTPTLAWSLKLDDPRIVWISESTIVVQ